MRRALLALAFVFGAVLLTACGGDLYAGMPEHVKRRHLALEGAPNFRDLGGYATSDGRSVKWGTLFRSDNLAHLTDDDLEKVSALGIRLVCDFRSAPEKLEEPDRLPAIDPPAVAALEIGIDGFAVNDLRARLTSGDTAGLDLREMLIEGNRQFAAKQAPTYATMFERITKRENLPALVHCSAGKDRAGFAAAAILSVLGVPRETVMADYLLTNHYTAAAVEKRLLMIELFSLTRADTDALRPLFGVESAYLEAAFAEIDQRFGSFEAYTHEALGLDDREVEEFRALVLE
jgi:protein-tyrosine phosphatase